MSSLFVYTGFMVGALNLLYLQPKFMTPEQIGLPRAILAVSSIFLNFALLASANVMLKFFPFYRDHLEERKNDILPLTVLLSLIGFLLTVTISFIFKQDIIAYFSIKSPLFATYYNWVYVFSALQVAYTVLETYSQSWLLTVFPTFNREIVQRVFTTVCVLLFAWGIFGYDVYVMLFSFTFFLPVVLLGSSLWKSGKLHFPRRFSKVTRRLKGKMFTYGSYMYGGVVISALAAQMDSIFIAGEVGLAATTVYMISDYIATILIVPSRTMAGVISPLYSRAWKEKGLAQIASLYSKSSLTQLVLALGMFGCIWLNIDNAIRFLGPEYASGKEIIFVLCIAKLLDLSFGLNSELLTTSNSWRFNFLSYVILVLTIIPLNFFMIRSLGPIGAAWSKRSSEGRDYLSVKLDDPSFNAPIYANLFDDEDAETFTLIWSRSRKPNGD
ncbi:MAG: DUF736 family protein [Bacteroidota bacterium]